MGQNIEFKKSTLIVIVSILVIGGFITFALVKMVSGKDNPLTGDLVQGGQQGTNIVTNKGDVQIVKLGVANYNYDPNTINVQAGKLVRIIGNMDQLSGCLRAFTIPKLGISKIFSKNDNVLEFTPSQPGSYAFSCSMGMGYGTLIVS